MTEDAYVSSVLQRYSLVASPLVPSPALRAANAVIPRLNAWANQWLASPITLSGSYAKGTAVVGTTDVDLFISLKNATPFSLKDIYNQLLDFAQTAGWNPRAQNVSIGIEYQGAKIDLVPAKVQAGLIVWHSLYVRKRDSWTQTNVTRHIATVRTSKRTPEIRALKIWRTLHGLDFPSFYLELTVIDALSGRGTTTLGRNAMRALEYIASSLPTARVVDPANTANIISDDLTIAEKRSIAAQAQVAARATNWNQILW
jgi:hypothetical protein